ncbi:hypothetical protein DY000_02036729, partial [Brassica cretica]
METTDRDQRRSRRRGRQRRRRIMETVGSKAATPEFDPPPDFSDMRSGFRPNGQQFNNNTFSSLDNVMTNQNHLLMDMHDTFERRFHFIFNNASMEFHQTRSSTNGVPCSNGVRSSATHPGFALQTISFLYKNLRERISKKILMMGSVLERGKEKSQEDSIFQQHCLLQQLKRKNHQIWRLAGEISLGSTYPNDSEKHLLAIRSGLTRSQVSNWFINARVRLWKPMIED